MVTEIWGHMPDGREVHRVTLKGGGLVAHVLTYGAVVQDLRLAGHDAPLVLGFAEFAPYLTESPYFGATVGRFANRIRDGHLELDGKVYQVDTNDGDRHTLHGGAEGLGSQLWEIAEVADNCVTLKAVLPDRHMGFPGTLVVRVTFALLEAGTFDIQMHAETDRTTLCSLAHHSYFTLDDAATVADHRLQIEADSYLPVDSGAIPTGRIAPVRDTRFDFREAAPVAKAHPLDHNFCLSQDRVRIRRVATLSSDLSGLQMTCLTTEPGVQVYDGAPISIEHPGLNGLPMGACAGIAIEPQAWPDAHHHTHFPQAVLRPGESYHQHTQFVFSRGQT